MRIDDVAARGFEAGAAAYELARPGYPDEAVARAGRDARHRRRARGCATWPPAPASSPAASSSSARRSSRSSRSTAMRAQLRDGAAGRRGRRRHRRGDPAAGRVGRRRHRRPGLPLVRRRRRRWPRSPACCKPGGGLAILWNERDERTPWVAEMSRIIRWHERTVSRYQHVDWAEVVAASGRFTAARGAGRALGAADDPRAAGRPGAVDQLHRGDAAEPSGSASPPRSSRSSAGCPSRSRLPVRLPRAVVPPTLTEPRRAAVLELVGASSGRDLPWRRTRDPWEVLVCEVMAQQTQVARVAERWRPFLDRFPTPAALRGRAGRRGRPAGGRGLGYNRRALDLHRCAPGGRRPTTAARCPPTSTRCSRCRASVRTRPAPCWRSPSSSTTASSTPTPPACWPGGPGAGSAPRRRRPPPTPPCPPGEAWAWNQAMLDLGATVCTRRDAGAATRARSPASCAWARGRLARARPGRRLRTACPGGQSPLRGQRPPGPRPPGRGPARARRSPPADLAAAMGWPDDPDRAERVAATLVADGLVGHETRHATASP